VLFELPAVEFLVLRLIDADLLAVDLAPVDIVPFDLAVVFAAIEAVAAVDVDESYPPEELASRRALSRQTLEMASSLALSDFAELHIVHAWHAVAESAMRGGLMPATEEKVIAYVEQVRQQHAASLDVLISEVTSNLGQDALDYLKPRTHMVKGWARKEIPALAKQIEADLIVIGTVARTGVPGFIIGNTAETILNQIDCSVLAIKPPGFVTPVTIVD